MCLLTKYSDATVEHEQVLSVMEIVLSALRFIKFYCNTLMLTVKLGAIDRRYLGAPTHIGLKVHQAKSS